MAPVPTAVSSRFPEQEGNEARRDAVVFAWFVPEELQELGEYYLGLLHTHHAGSKLFIGMNHGSDPAWEGRCRDSGLDVTIAWARPELGDYWDATGFLTALEAFQASDEAFDLVWFGHSKGGSAAFGRDAQIRAEQERNFWARRDEIAHAFEDATLGLFAPRYNLTPPYPFPGPWKGWSDEMGALQRVFRGEHAPLGLCALDTVFVLRGEIVRRFCREVDATFFATDPAAYGANKWFFEMAYPSIAAMQGYAPFIDMDVPGANDPRDDVMLPRDVQQVHRLAGEEVARWRTESREFQPRIMEWDLPAWQKNKPGDGGRAAPAAGERAVAHGVEARGWLTPLGAGELEPQPFAAEHTLRIVLDEPMRDAFRVRLGLTARGLEVLRLGLLSGTGDRERTRNVYLDVARPGALHHELERVALHSSPTIGYFELELEGSLEGGETPREIAFAPAGADLGDVPVAEGMAIGLQRVEVQQTSGVSKVTRFVPERFPERPRPAKRKDGKRDAVIFAWWTPDNTEAAKVGEHYIELLKYHHADSKIYVGVNGGSDPSWIERLQTSGLDIDVRSARPEIEIDSDTAGFIAALDSYYHSDESFDLVWFGHTKGASQPRYSDYIKTRHRIERVLWVRRYEVEQRFANPSIGLVASRLVLTPTEAGHIANLPALKRIYRGKFEPIGLHAFETFYVMRDASIRSFCRDVGDTFFTTNPHDFGGNRWFFEMAIPSIPSMQGLEPYVDLDVEGEDSPRDDVSLVHDVKQNHRLAAAEIARWKRDPRGFQPRQIPWSL